MDWRNISSAINGFISSTAAELKEKHQSHLDPQDLVQEGVVGLLTAARDSPSWEEFAGRVEPRIIAAIEEAIKVEININKLHAELRLRLAEYRKARAALFAKFGRPPTLLEIGKETNLSLEVLERLEDLYQTALDYEDD
jgi:DNA-directed RNA polymerase specialized sigma subunit